ncbi:hypothetical protein PENSPDRAFT_207367 [Peniophora sp. CONT]|nr:hypothetical protein PENSPDRAFT_207367 [Peniophora sp. CONT]
MAHQSHQSPRHLSTPTQHGSGHGMNPHHDQSARPYYRRRSNAWPIEENRCFAVASNNAGGRNWTDASIALHTAFRPSATISLAALGRLRTLPRCTKISGTSWVAFELLCDLLGGIRRGSTSTSVSRLFEPFFLIRQCCISSCICASTWKSYAASSFAQSRRWSTLHPNSSVFCLHVFSR